MGIYTSRYSNKELADGKYYCVGISIGTPKFKLAYRLENQCYSLAPKGYMLRMMHTSRQPAYSRDNDTTAMAEVWSVRSQPTHIFRQSADIDRKSVV